MNGSLIQRRTLIDDEKQAAFELDGYAVLDLVDPRVIERFAARFDRLYVGEREGFHSSLESSDFEYRDELGAALVETFSHLVDEFFEDHAVIMAQATVKWTGGDSTVGIHQDWSIVDERQFRSLNMWIPLVTTDDENGGLYVLPGSQEEFRRLRPNGGFPSWYRDPAMSVDPSAFVPVHVRAGQAIISNHAILHRSPSNRSPSPRIAVVLALAPREATLYHSFRYADDRIIRYTIDRPSFFQRVIAYEDPQHLTQGFDYEFVEFDVPDPNGQVLSAPETATSQVVRRSADQPVVAEFAQSRRQTLWRHLLRRARPQSRHR